MALSVGWQRNNFGYWRVSLHGHPPVASYPGFVAVLYGQSDINQTDYKGGLELHPYSKITKMPVRQCLRCDLGHSQQGEQELQRYFLEPWG